jgi:hypothetical protein
MRGGPTLEDGIATVLGARIVGDGEIQDVDGDAFGGDVGKHCCKPEADP